MEPITAIVLFAGIVVSWLFLPSVPPAEKSGHGAPAGAASKA
jgi:hypothetical protein